MMQKIKKNGIQHIFFLLCFLGYGALTLFLFHRQSVSYAGKYTSDMLSYIANMQGIDSGFRFPYPVYFWVGKFFHLFLNPELAMAVATTGMNGAAVLILYGYLYKFLLPMVQNKKGLTAILATVMTFSCFFISMLYPMTPDYLLAVKDRYLGVFSPNPYHNATYLAARPFTIICFFMYADFVMQYENKLTWTKENWKKPLWFTCMLLLATMTKPSFSLPFIVLVGITLLVRLIHSKGKNWAGTWRFGMCFLPAGIDMIYQYSGVFSKEVGQNLGIGFGIGTAWYMHTDSITKSVILGLAFPIVVLVFHIRDVKRDAKLETPNVTADVVAGKKLLSEYQLSWELLAVSFLMAVFLYEKGYRMNHMNFSWGYMCGMFFAYVVSTMVLLGQTFQNGEKNLKRKILIGAEWLLFLYQLVCGIIYFSFIMQGGLFH